MCLGYRVPLGEVHNTSRGRERTLPWSLTSYDPSNPTTGNHRSTYLPYNQLDQEEGGGHCG